VLDYLVSDRAEISIRERVMGFLSRAYIKAENVIQACIAYGCLNVRNMNSYRILLSHL